MKKDKLEFKQYQLVTLKKEAKKVEVLYFEHYQIYFEPGDVGEVFTVKSPRLRYKKGLIDYQTVIKFEKNSETDLIVRVETENLVSL